MDCYRVHGRYWWTGHVRFSKPTYNSGSNQRGSIYLVRLALTSYYDYRISRVQGHLNGLQEQRDATIDKLKASTKYNTTQELLDKYGGRPSPKRKPSNQKVTPVQEVKGNLMGERTSFVPPPTANIPGRNLPLSRPETPQRMTPDKRGTLLQKPPSATNRTPESPKSDSYDSDTAEFAPNAFSAPIQYATTKDSSKWYDRIMDVLLGEDETLPRNRLALICVKCRLVNGQAPPGVKRLEEVGKWRCSSCGAMNGEEDEAAQIVKTIKQKAAPNLQKPSQNTQEVGRRNREAAIIPLPDVQSDDPPNDSDREIADSEDSVQEDTSAVGDSPEAEESPKAQTRSTRVESKTKEPTEPTDSPETDPPKRKRGRPKGSGKPS